MDCPKALVVGTPFFYLGDTFRQFSDDHRTGNLDEVVCDASTLLSGHDGCVITV